VRRLDEDAGLVRLADLVHVLDRLLAAGEVVDARAEDPARRLAEALVPGRADDERLDGRAGLVGVREAAVLEGLLGGAADRVGRERRARREREDEAGARLDDDAAGAPGLPLLAES